MKAERKPQVPVKQDIVLTLTPEEAKALFHIIADFDAEDDAEDDAYMVPDSGEQFDVTLHSALLELGVNRE